MDNATARLQNGAFKYLEEINEAIVRQVPLNTGPVRLRALDVGCGTGVSGEAVEKKGYAVWGIELNVEAAERARHRLTKVINSSLTNTVLIKKEIGEELFDCLIFADILEHLYDPLTIIREYLNFLKPGGLVLVSLPNTVAWTRRIMFLLGNFEYNDTGIMDRDHIRFFTFKSAKRLLRDAGCEVIGTDFVPFFTRALQSPIKKFLLKINPLTGTDHRLLVDSPYYKFYLRCLYPVEYALGSLRKSLFAFKMIVVGRKGSSGPVPAREGAHK